MRSIALANQALAAFEGGDDSLAIRVARQVLRRDPDFLDCRAALTAFLYGSGKFAEAEQQWDQLQDSQGKQGRDGWH
jgi:Flp pilus assembly protein TadD